VPHDGFVVPIMSLPLSTVPHQYGTHTLYNFKSISNRAYVGLLEGILLFKNVTKYLWSLDLRSVLEINFAWNL
jgi:hypothetical protein